MTARAGRATLRGVRVLVAPLVLVLALTLTPLISVLAQTTPQLTLSLPSALPGVSLIATGAGFPSGATGQLFWSDGTPIASFGIDGAGAFAIEMVVPDVAPGPYTLAARSDDGTTVAEAVLTVEEVPPPVEPTVPEATLAPTLPPVEPTVPEETLAPATEEVPLPEPTVPEATLEPTPPPWYPIVASGHSDSSPDAGVVYDGDPATFWLTDPVAPAEAWLTLDLGAIKPIGSARWLLATAGTLPLFEIQLSEDGVTWASLPVIDGAVLPVGTWSEQAVDVWARYVRFQIPNPTGLPQLGGFAEIEIWPAADARPISAIVTPEAAPAEIAAAPASTPQAEISQRSMAVAALPGDSLSLPLRAAFYYPWFPGAWDQQGVYPYSVNEPSRGYYNGGDPSVVSSHIADMQYGNIQVGISSWWGQGSREDARMPQLLSAASGTGFKWTVYYEDEGFGNPSVDTLRSDLEYLRDQYAADPSYLRIDGRFVVFVYGGVESCEMVDRWSQANETVNAYIVLKVFGGYAACGNQPDSWHQYGPATADDGQGSWSYTISPGFHLYGNAERLPRDLARWQQSVRNMVGSGANWQLITTFNEWGEATSVESGTRWASASGYGQYLDVLHANGQGALPGGAVPTATTAPKPTATTAPTPTTTTVAGPTAVPINPLALAPLADARIKSGSPSTNYGAETKLGSDQSPVEVSYLRFDVQSLSGAPGRAVLRLWVTDSTSNGPKLVSVTDTTWSEAGITWNNRPATGSTIGDVGTASSGQWIEYDVTSAIAGNGPVSFALLADSTNGIDIASREAAAAQRPQLVLTPGGGPAAPTPAPTQVQTPAPTQGPAPVPTGVPGGSGPTYGPAADAQVAAANPGTNYGTGTTLQSDMTPAPRSIFASASAPSSPRCRLRR